MTIQLQPFARHLVRSFKNTKLYADKPHSDGHRRVRTSYPVLRVETGRGFSYSYLDLFRLREAQRLPDEFFGACVISIDYDIFQHPKLEEHQLERLCVRLLEGDAIFVHTFSIGRRQRSGRSFVMERAIPNYPAAYYLPPMPVGNWNCRLDAPIDKLVGVAPSDRVRARDRIVRQQRLQELQSRKSC